MSQLSKYKMLFYLRNAIETIEAAIARRPNEAMYIAHCEGKINAFVWIREKLLKRHFEDEEGGWINITEQHAFSVSELVKYFKKMIEQGNMPDSPGRSDELTVGYCDELLKDLEEGK